MQFIKTRKDMAEFLAQLAWADFPLSLKRRAEGGFIISGGGQGQALCRYNYEAADIAEEARRLERIIVRLCRFAAAADNRQLRPSAEAAAQFQEAVRRAWAAKLSGKEKIGARDGVYAVPNLPRWSVAIDGPKMTPGLVLSKAARLGLGDELALALLGRIIKAGIMPLALVTYGKTDYDLRYRADFDRLKKFLQMPPAELEALLSPPAETAGAREDATFPVDWPIVQTPLPAEGETAKADEERQTGATDFGGKSSAVAGNAAASGSESGGAYGQEETQNGEAVLGRRRKDWSSAPGRKNSPESGSDGGNRPGQEHGGESRPDAGMNAGGKNGWGLLSPSGKKEPGMGIPCKIIHASLLSSGSKKEPGTGAGYGTFNEGESELFPVPLPRRPRSGIITPYPPEPAADEETGKAHVIGTQKHAAITQKLRRELSPIFLMHKDLYECKKRIKFTKEDGDFNTRELRIINDIMKLLRKADFILVEYSVPTTEVMQGQNRKVDLAAFYKNEGKLRIIDWKFGLNYVPLDKNAQLKAYASCLLKYVFPPSNVNIIEKIIVQPNQEEGTKIATAYL